MKKINVIVKGKELLELAEDGKKGDLIDLKELTQVDESYIDNIIASGKDKSFNSRIEEVRKTLNAENLVKINELNNKISSLEKQHESELKINAQNIEKEYLNKIADLNNIIEKLKEATAHEKDNILNEKNLEINKLQTSIETLKKENESALVIKEQEVAKTYENNIAGLKQEIEILKSTKKSDLENLASKNEAELSKYKDEANSKYADLEQKYKVLMAQHENQVKQVKLEVESDFNNKIAEMRSKQEVEKIKFENEVANLKASFENEKLKVLAEQKEKYDEEIRAKEDIINHLQRTKAAMNVKQTGEDLEAWCDSEIRSYMQNGLFNCTWDKDNTVVKEEGESKGSKADFIFKVYADDKHNPKEILASVCLDMKDENPDSVNKKTNADYYSQLDKNREKKNCRYAVLVSNLELGKPNDLQIFKVREYENMYVVRPAYLSTFLNMIASLTTRFADLITSKEKEMIELKTKLNLIDEFEEIKKTYLDKPLESLEKSVEAISNSSESIKKACKNIDDQCDKINRSYINQIEEKISKYEIKFDRKICKELK